MLEIRKCTVSEVENMPNFSELLEKYGEELNVDGAPPWAAEIELYYQLEKLGIFQVFGAFVQETMIGFVTVLVTVLPHNGVVMAATESYFVLQEYRNTGAGDKLRNEAEKYAVERGAPYILISAPMGGPLAEVLSHKKEYAEISRVFFRKLNHV